MDNTCSAVTTDAPVYMRMRVVNVRSEHETESDYDTAVDMSHSSIDTHEVTLETVKGLRIVVSSTEITTSYSYMEPDFDHLEETGNVVYQSHADDTKEGSSSSHCNVTVGLPEEVMTLRELQAAGCEDWFDLYEEHMLTINRDAMHGLAARVAEITWQMKGKVYMLPVTPEVADAIASFETKLAERHATNLSIRLQNKCDLALQKLAEMKDAAMRSIGWRTHCFMEQTFS